MVYREDDNPVDDNLEVINMPRVNVKSKSPYGKKIGFSRAVRIGNTIAVSGTAPVGPDGKPAYPGDLYNQTKYCLEIIGNAISEAGGSLRDVIRTRVYLTDIIRWYEAGKAHGEIFGEIMPACTFVEVKGLIEKEWLVEIEADCVIEER
jgi:enamine deaminase RidA (YjgF/YER057c/UK114 family)